MAVRATLPPPPPAISDAPATAASGAHLARRDVGYRCGAMCAMTDRMCSEPRREMSDVVCVRPNHQSLQSSIHLNRKKQRAAGTEARAHNTIHIHIRLYRRHRHTRYGKRPRPAPARGDRNRADAAHRRAFVQAQLRPASPERQLRPVLPERHSSWSLRRSRRGSREEGGGERFERVTISVST